jgi:TRAP-type uncharacterized transport system fused permease subunit
MKSLGFLVIRGNLTDAVTRPSYRGISLLHGRNAKRKRMEMTFELVRLGWPNTAAILALAVMPVVALSSASNTGTAAAPVRPAETAAFCPDFTDGLMALADVGPNAVFE